MTSRIRPGDFAEITAFAAVAQARSFRHAARDLGLAPSTLSHAVKALEARLGMRLLHRTTRAVAPTEEGARLLAELSPALAALDTAMAGAGREPDEAVGTVRLAAPRIAIRTLVAPAMARLARAHPRLVLDVRTVEHPGDLIADGFDLGIQLGATIGEAMVAVDVGTARLLGTVEIITAFLFIASPWSPRAALGAGLLGSGTFAVTCSTLLALPIWEPTAGGFPFLNFSGTFLIKDVALLGVSLVVLSEGLTRTGLDRR